MTPAKLSLASLRSRKLTSALTVLTITLSVSLFIVAETVRHGVENSLRGGIAKTDLIVGGPQGRFELLLASAFHIGDVTGGIASGMVDGLLANELVEWALPLSFGDSHRGRRVIGTRADFFEHYRYAGDAKLVLAEGRIFSAAREVVVGSAVAAEFGYAVGSKIIVAHGIGGLAMETHDEHPFTVVGVLKTTRTAVDRALWVSTESLALIHEGWDDGAAPLDDDSEPGFYFDEDPLDGGFIAAESSSDTEGEAHDDHEDHEDHGEHGDHEGHDHLDEGLVSAILVGLKDRKAVLTIQNDLMQSETPLTAILPGLVLSEMMQTFGYGEKALRWLTIGIILVGLLGMMIATYTNLDSRRREIAILRSVGASPSFVLATLLFEAVWTIATALVLGFVAAAVALVLVSGWLYRTSGLAIDPAGIFSGNVLITALVFFCVGSLLGCLPAYKAYSQSKTLNEGWSL